RPVALKLLPGATPDEAARRRFLREARAAARLHHPNIVTLYDAGVAGRDAFLVMELVPGGTLRALGRLPLPAALHVGRQLADALAHAHGVGVVHRDLKPENVVIASGGESPHVKLIDFGLASAVGTSRLTSAGDLLGTPAYIAPEQILGRDADAR